MREAWRESGTGARARALLGKHDRAHISDLNADANSPPDGENR